MLLSSFTILVFSNSRRSSMQTVGLVPAAPRFTVISVPSAAKRNPNPKTRAHGNVPAVLPLQANSALSAAPKSPTISKAGPAHAEQ